MIKSINEPENSRDVMLTPTSINEPVPLPDGPPTVEGINPTEVPEGTASQLIVVHGSNFIESCVVNFNGVDWPTVYERPDKINATVSLATLPAGEYAVVVRLLGAESPPETFTIVAAEEAIGESQLAVDGEQGFVDPDELEDEIEQAGEEGDFKPTHRAPGHTLSNKRSKNAMRKK